MQFDIHIRTHSERRYSGVSTLLNASLKALGFGANAQHHEGLPRYISLGIAIGLAAILFTAQAISSHISLWFALALFALSIPHGALERTASEPYYVRPTLAYTTLYLVFAVVIFSSWLINPAITFVLFLGLSSVHFAAHEPDHKIFGLWVILGSGGLYAERTLQIFSTLIGYDATHPAIIAGYHYASLLLAAYLIAQIIYQSMHSAPYKPLRSLCFIAIFLALPPIEAVAVYFFVFHSLDEMVRTIQGYRSETKTFDALTLLKLYAPASLPAMIGAVSIVSLVLYGYLPIAVAMGLGVAFVVPHMLPVEKLLELDRQQQRL